MAKILPSEAPNPSISPSEIQKMEKLLKETNDQMLSKSSYKKLTEEANAALGQTESEALQMEQVQACVENMKKCQATDGASSPTPSKDQAASDISLSNDESESLDFPKADAEEKAFDVTVLEFEAKSRDEAWYDVDVFLAHRYADTGDLEVRVRFCNYGAEHDEWVNVKRQVRERSVPLDATDCKEISEGDVVLCFRERGEQAIYFDAHVRSIKRRQHDIRGCRCLFTVRYDHDRSEEVVTARKVCRRPL